MHVCPFLHGRRRVRLACSNPPPSCGGAVVHRAPQRHATAVARPSRHSNAAQRTLYSGQKQTTDKQPCDERCPRTQRTATVDRRDDMPLPERTAGGGRRHGRLEGRARARKMQVGHRSRHIRGRASIWADAASQWDWIGLDPVALAPRVTCSGWAGWRDHATRRRRCCRRYYVLPR